MGIPLDALVNGSRLEEMRSAIGLLRTWQELTFRQPLLQNPSAFYHEKERIAAILVDNHLGKLARRVRMLGENIDLDSPEFLVEWAEIVFFTLLWTRFDELSDGLQLNLVYQSGPNITKKHLANEEHLLDRFVVVGQELGVEERLTRRSVYVYGLGSMRFFVILDYSFNQQPFDFTYQVSRMYQGEVVVYPFPGSLRISPLSMNPTPGNAGFYEDIPALDMTATLEKYHEALEINPFCSPFPAMIVLQSEYGNGKWRIVDSSRHEVKMAVLDHNVQAIFHAVCFRKPVRMMVLLTREGIRPLSYYNGEEMMGFEDRL